MRSEKPNLTSYTDLAQSDERENGSAKSSEIWVRD